MSSTLDLAAAVQGEDRVSVSAGQPVLPVHMSTGRRPEAAPIDGTSALHGPASPGPSGDTAQRPVMGCPHKITPPFRRTRAQAPAGRRVPRQPLSAAARSRAAAPSDDDNPTVSPAPTRRAARLAAARGRQGQGQLVVGSDVAYAPVEFFDTDGKTVIGIDPDIAKAIGKQLGIELKFVNGTFDGLITALKTQAHRPDHERDERQQEAPGEVDFVDYFTAGTSILVEEGQPEGHQGPGRLLRQDHRAAARARRRTTSPRRRRPSARRPASR